MTAREEVLAGLLAASVESLRIHAELVDELGDALGTALPDTAVAFTDLAVSIRKLARKFEGALAEVTR